MAAAMITTTTIRDRIPDRVSASVDAEGYMSVIADEVNRFGAHHTITAKTAATAVKETNGRIQPGGRASEEPVRATVEPRFGSANTSRTNSPRGFFDAIVCCPSRCLVGIRAVSV
jgi:hypothetical protein